MEPVKSNQPSVKRVYGIRNNGVESLLDEKTYQKHYSDGVKQNKFALDEKTQVEGQQLKPSRNNGDGLFYREEEAETDATQKEDNKNASFYTALNKR